MRILVIIFIIVLPVFSFAQGGLGGGPGGGNPGGDPDKVPITGVEWLLVAGGLFGARKLYKNFRGHAENH